MKDEKNKGGRPLKFTTAAELRQKIEQYFGECDSHEATRKVFVKKADGSQYLSEEQYLTERIPYGVEGLARALRTNRETLNVYGSGEYDHKDDTDPAGEKFSDAIKDARQRINEDVERRMLMGLAPGASGIFWLKNNAGWKDRQEIDHTTKDQPIPLLGGTTQLPPAEDDQQSEEPNAGAE